MADRKPFLLRIDRDVLSAVHRWADDDLRSVNGQIEFLLRDALKRAGRSSVETTRRTSTDAADKASANATNKRTTDSATNADSDT